MGLPPTSPRFKFTYTHPVGTSSNLAVPSRPPRQPPPPSTRSRSLELLDQQDQEQKLVSSTVVQRPPLPRPRSRSLDGLLDEDAKTGEEQNKVQREKSQECLPTSSEDDKVISISEKGQEKPDTETVESKDEPRPVLKMKPKSDTIESKSETQDMRVSLDKNESNREAPPTRPPKPSRRSSSEGQSSTCSSRQYADQEHSVEEQRIKKIAQERLMQSGKNGNYDEDDRSTMLKASRSCGAGLDSDGSVSSSEYGGHRARAKGPGSLLSLPTGAEPKRKRNFMDKCVNKVRSFMKK